MAISKKPYIQTYFISLLILLSLTACSSEKFLGQNEYRLSSVKISSDTSSVNASSYTLYVRQLPNSKWFNLFKVPLALYSLSGTDTTKSINRFWRRIGEAPVIFDEQQMVNTQNSIVFALKDKGYLNARVTTIKTTEHHNKRIKLNYKLHPGKPYIIKNIHLIADDNTIDSLINISKSESLLSPGMMCDVSILDKERIRITTMLHNQGYYNVLKNFIHYEIDTLSGPNNVDLTLVFAGKSIASDTLHVYDRYHLRNINIRVNNEKGDCNDSCYYSQDNFSITYTSTKHHTLRYKLLKRNSLLQPNELYSEQNITKTYQSFSKLNAIGYTSIQLNKTDSAQLDANIQLVPAKINSIGVEFEGTNTAGNIGIASTLTYNNRNLFNGSETWSTSIKGAYEAITGLEGYSNQNYIEIGIETKLSFPRLILPIASAHKYRGTSNLSLQFDTQERPEFHRRVFTTLWNYQWSNKSGSISNRLDFPSLNYVYMPWISKTFREEYLQSDNYHSALIRYAYENLLILNFTYSHTYKSNTNNNVYKNRPSYKNKLYPYQLSWSIESAGNLLYAFSHSLKLSRNKEGQYSLFNVAYAQYVKFDLDFSQLFILNSRNSLATHFAFGLSHPYGNSTIVPFEKRYFAGGANGIRGWAVRELGPGKYKGEDGKVDFINQTGNLKLLCSIELRTQLLWKFSGAVFVDAGNIWTTRKYDVTGKGGQFNVSTFLKQLAASYGIGLRMNLDYFIIRLDMAMKGINPAYSPSNKNYLPLLRPKFSRDFTFHFAIGLPF